jgi:dihydropyrimidinase
MFGLYPRKGVIAPGSDADIVIYDPVGRTEIGFHKTHHMNMDHSAWEGFVIDGHVDTVLSRGKVVVENNEYKGVKGHGQYLKRGLSQYLI